MADIQTCAVKAIIHSSNGGPPVANAQIQVQLIYFEIYEGFVSPPPIRGVTDANGECVLDLFPNELGQAASYYKVSITAEGKSFKSIAVVPNAATAFLHEIVEIPVYDGKPDGYLVLARLEEIYSYIEAVTPKFLPNAPTNPLPGSRWTDADTGKTYEWVVTASSSAWFETGSAETIGYETAIQAAQSASDAADSATDAQTAKGAAEAARDQAVPAAATATTQATAATTAKTAAETAKTAAEAARDSTMLSANLAVDEPTGRLTVADGATFLTQGNGADVASYGWRRINAATVSTLIAVNPAADAVNKKVTPFARAISATNAAGSADLYARMMRGITDVSLYGLPAGDSYYFERVRRNIAGSWHIVVKRASDAATVLQLLGAVTEPADPAAEQRLLLPSVVTGAIGYITIRWSEFVAGATNVGLTMTLSPDCLNRSLATREKAMPRTAARIGQVPLTTDPTAFVTVNEATRTVTWPELRIVDGRGNNFGYLKLAAGSITFTAAMQIAYLDLVAAAAVAGGSAIPAANVVLGTYGIEDPNGSGYYGASHQFPIAWSSGAGRVDLNPMLRAAASAATTTYRDDIVVKRDIANNVVSVYLRANGNDANALTYIRYDLFHYVAASLADVWTLAGVFEVTRTGYESFTAGKELVTPVSEMLCALQEQGAADFMGGRAHGNEAVTQTPTLLIDGAAVSLADATLAYFHGSDISFYQSSKLYRYGTALGTPLADRRLWLNFRGRDMVADQRIEHLASYTLQAGYLAMLPPHRYSTYTGASEDNTSSQISGKFIDNARCIPLDVASQAAPVGSDYQQLSPPITRCKLFGTYGVECEMESVSVSDAILQNVFFMQRAQYAYNKAYIGFISSISGAQAVTAATKWQAKTRWRFDSKN